MDRREALKVISAIAATSVGIKEASGAEASEYIMAIVSISGAPNKQVVEGFREGLSQVLAKHPGKRPVTKGRVSVFLEDGDPFNTIEHNLTLLCPNCHSLTPTYGSLNTGRGRTQGAVVQREDIALAAR